MAPKTAKAAPKPAAKAAAPPAKPVEKKAEAKKAPAGTSNGVYVKNWGGECVETAKTVFGAAGKVQSVQLRRNKYCIVFFDNAASAKKAVDTFNNKDIRGRTLQVVAAKTSPKADKHANSAVVFVAPIFRESTTRKQIFEFFGSCGKVLKLRTSRQNGAYISFDSSASANKAAAKNGSEFMGKNLRVSLSTRSIAEDKKTLETTKLRIAVHDWKKST
eukprot:419020_1